MFRKFKAAILLSLAIAACSQEDPSIEYYTLLSSRSAEYEMYNEGTTTKLPTYWGTYDSYAAADSAGKRQYDSWTNRMWRPEDWVDPGPRYVTVINEILVDTVKPEDQKTIESLESQISNVESDIAEINRDMQDMTSCVVEGGVVIKNNETVPLYTVSEVSYGNLCPSPVLRTCRNGTLSGSNTSAKYAMHSTCQVLAGDSCEVTTPRISSLEKRWDGSYRWFIDYKQKPHGTTMDLWERGFDRECSSNIKRTRTCVDGSWTGNFSSEFISDSCNIISVHMPTGRTAEKTEDIVCPTIASYNQMNTHNYPREFSDCKNLCFDRTGYFGSLLPESHPDFYANTSASLREDCFKCEMSQYDNKCFYPRDEFHVFRYQQPIDPKKEFNLSF